MGAITHRLGQIIGGGIVAGAGYGLTFLKATAQAYFRFMESFPVNIPTLLDYSSWVLYGIGGLMAGWGTLGLLYIGVRHMLAGGEDEQPPQQPSQQPQQQQSPQQGQQPGQGQPQQQPSGQSRQRQQGRGRQQGQQRQPPRDQRDEQRR